MPPDKVHWIVLALVKDDYEEIRTIKKVEGLKVRADALERLTQIVDELDVPDVKAGKKRLRLGVPRALYEALKCKASATGLDQRALLILAAREYRRRAKCQQDSREAKAALKKAAKEEGMDETALEDAQEDAREGTPEAR